VVAPAFLYGCSRIPMGAMLPKFRWTLQNRSAPNGAAIAPSLPIRMLAPDGRGDDDWHGWCGRTGRRLNSHSHRADGRHVHGAA